MGRLLGSSVLPVSFQCSPDQQPRWPAGSGLPCPSHPHSSGCVDSLVVWPWAGSSCLCKTLPPQSQCIPEGDSASRALDSHWPDNTGIQSRLWVTSPGPARRSDQQNLRERKVTCKALTPEQGQR